MLRLYIAQDVSVSSQIESKPYQKKMAQYLKIEGKVLGHQLYSAGGYLYQEKGFLQNGEQRLRCTKWRKEKCLALGTLCQTTHRVFNTAHTCRRDPLEVPEILLRNQLKQTVVQDVRTPLSRLFQNVCSNFAADVVERVKFSSVRGHLSALRKKKIEELANKDEVEDDADDEDDTDDTDDPRPCGSRRKDPKAAGSRGRNTCSICLQIIKSRPVINVPCGHGFCKPCSTKAYKAKKVCAICREDIQKRLTYFQS